MIIRVLNGPMAPDEGSAVAQAIALAHGSLGAHAEKMHIHVISVLEVGDHMYQAILKVELEPALKKTEEEEPEEESEKPETVLEEELETTEEEHEEKPKAEQKPAEEIHPTVTAAVVELPQYQPAPIEQEIERFFFTEYEPGIPQDPTMHIYMLQEEAPRYYDPKYYIEHPDYTFHFMNRGSLWEAAHKLHPDMDLYESAHPDVAELMEAEKRYQIELKNDLEQKRALEKSKRLVQELADEF